jgi:hypothetical protein
MKKLTASRAAQLAAHGAKIFKNPAPSLVPVVVPANEPTVPTVVQIDTAGIERILSQFTLDHAGLLGALRSIRVPQPVVTVQAAPRVAYTDIEVTDVIYKPGKQGRVSGLKARFTTKTS